MKIKLSEIVIAQESIANLLEVKMPVKVSYRIKRLIGKLTPILKSYDEKRNELVKEYGEKDEEKDTYQVKDSEKLKEFYSKIQELQELEEEVDFETIELDELGDITIEPKNLVTWIFE